MKRIVIFGGTFDPIHNAHIRIANHVSKKLNADIYFVIAKNPRWKVPGANISHRLKMLQLALSFKKNKRFFISTYEIDNNADINYTIDTVKYFKKEFKDAQLYLLIGLDQVNDFHRWKDANEISILSKIIFVTRSNITCDNENTKIFNMKNMKYDKAGNTSSSDIRNLHNLDIPYNIIKYIEENELYYIKKVKDYYNDKRFKHALSVANLAYQIAENNNLKIKKECYIAGLLHDVAKNIDLRLEKELMNKMYQEYVNMVNNKLYHQFLGEYIANKDFDITNMMLLDAIKYHASGKANMSEMGEIIYSSDKIDPLRGYDSKQMITLCKKDYHKGFIKVLEENRKFLLAKKIDFFNPLTKECFKFYLGV